MPIAEICSRGVVIANPDDSLRTVAALMRVHHVGSVVVTRDDAGLCRPLGIITDRDIVLALVAKDVSPDAVSAGDVMSEPLETLNETDEVWTALERMRSRGVRRLPVRRRAQCAAVIAPLYCDPHVSSLIGALCGTDRRKHTWEASQVRAAGCHLRPWSIKLVA